MRRTTNNNSKHPAGLTIRKFDGKVSANPQAGKPETTYAYDHIVFPWSRAGKDINGEMVVGSVPQLTDLLKYCSSELCTTNEFELDSAGSPKAPSIAGLLADGINMHLNRMARTKAVNTPEVARDKAIHLFMVKTGMAHDQARAFLKAAA